MKMIAFIPSAFCSDEGIGVFHLPDNEVTPYCTGRVGYGHLTPGQSSLLQAERWESGTYFRVPAGAGCTDHEKAKKEALLNALKRAGWNYSD